MKTLLAFTALLLASGGAFAQETPKEPIAQCKTCHGPELAGKAKSPAIAGKDKAKILESLTTKVPKQMTAVAKKLTDAEKEAVSDQISKMPKPPETPATPPPPPG